MMDARTRRPFPALHAAFVSLTLLLSCTPPLLAQVTFAGTQLVVADSLASPTGVATDGKNTLYIADRDNGRILSVTPTGTGYAPPQTLVTGLSRPQAIAADWYGNLFIADTGDNSITMIPVTGSGYASPRILASGLNQPSGIAVDSYGNLYVADTGNNQIVELPNLGNGYGSPIVVGTGFNRPRGVAVDAARSLYIADTGNNSIFRQTLKTGSYGAPQLLQKGLSSPSGIAVDKNLNLYITDSGNHQVEELPWFGLVGYYYPIFTIGSNFNQEAGVAVDFTGNVYIADAGNNRISTLRTSNVGFDKLPVGSDHPAQRYNFKIAANTTVGSIAVVTEGIVGKDFVDAGDSSCLAQTYATASFCGVDVTFRPLASGLRSGAIVLYDPAGYPLATAFLNGTGTQPQAAFFPGTVTRLETQLSGPAGVAVDANGNVFIADTGNDRVVELPSTGTGFAPQTTLPMTGVSSPMGMAIDGAGNLYIASNDNDRVIKLPWTGTGFGKQTTVGTGLYGPSAVAVDGFGNVFIADTMDNSVWRIPWTGSGYSREVWAPDYCKIPTGVAIDPAGNLFFAMPYINWLAEVPFAAGRGSQRSLPITGVSFAVSIAVDGNGNLYVVDSTKNQVVMLPRTADGFGDQVTVAKNLNAPSAIAIDTTGNLYIADTGSNSILKVDLSHAAPVTFATTNLGSTSSDSRQVVWMQNTGNEPLVIDDLAYPSDFPEVAGTTSDCVPGFTLPPGSGCAFSVNFTPLVAGSPLQEQIVLTDNTGNTPGTAQTIPLSGTAVGKSLQTIRLAPIADVVFGAPAIVLAAQASSGLPVTYQVLSGPAALIRNGPSLMLTGAGPVVIQVCQAGNSAFQPAPAANLTFNVLPAALTVTPTDTVAVYGSIPPAYGYTLTGFVSGQSAAGSVTGKAVILSSGTSLSPVGDYTLSAVQGTLAASNYTFVFRTWKLTVNPATLSVQANSFSNPYGKILPFLSWTFSGFRNGDTAAVLQGAPILSTAANSGSPVGTYLISASAGSLQAANYIFQFNPGSLTIVPATLTIAATSLQSTYGSALPQLTWSVTGLVQGNTRSMIAGAPVITTQAVSGSPAGTYPIAIARGTLTANNYNFVFLSGTLTIQKAPLTITAASASITYGQPLPAVTYTLSGWVNGDTPASAVSGTPALTNTLSSTSRPGSYSLSVALGSLTSRNYSFVLVNGSLTIAKALLTLTPRPALIVYGAALPKFAYNTSGFVFSDGPSSVRGQASFWTPANETSPAGSYPITGDLGTLASDNYSFRILDGTLTIQKALLTITPSPATMVYGSPLPAFSYLVTGFVNGEGNSVLSGTPALSTAASPSSVAGVYVIQAAVGSLSAANYTFACSTAKLTISKIPLTVTPDNLSYPYGAVTPPFTYTVTGFVNGDTSAVLIGKPVLWSTAPSTGQVGVYAVQSAIGSLSAANYTFQLAAGTVTITKAVLTIAATPASMTYGAPLPSLTYKITGFMRGESAQVLLGSPILTTSFSPGSPAGLYSIVPSIGTLAASNYTFQTLPGTLTVNKATLLVTPSDASMTYGDPLPVFSYQVTGFIDGDNPNVVIGSPMLTSKASAVTPIGVYPILADVTGLTAANYSFQAAPGKLTISRALLTVTPYDVSTTYGSTYPAFTWKVTGFRNGEGPTLLSGTPFLKTSVSARTPVGVYPWEALPGTLSAANYAITGAAAKLTVNPAILTVTALPASMTYGGVVPPLSYLLQGFASGESAALVSGSPSITTSASSLSPVGSYPINLGIGSLTAANYTFAFVSGIVTVNKASLKVIPGSASMVYGAPLPAFASTLSGFVNADTAASATTGSPQVSTAATSTSRTGNYAITSASGSLSAPNYTFSFQIGVLTVTQAPLLITADNQSMKVGASVPAQTFTATGFVNGDTLATATTGKPVLTTSASSASKAGTYPIVAVQGSMGSTNYRLSFANGLMTVAP